MPTHLNNIFIVSCFLFNLQLLDQEVQQALDAIVHDDKQGEYTGREV